MTKRQQKREFKRVVSYLKLNFNLIKWMIVEINDIAFPGFTEN